jgi:hypothetical protein
LRQRDFSRNKLCLHVYFSPGGSATLYCQILIQVSGDRMTLLFGSQWIVAVEVCMIFGKS